MSSTNILKLLDEDPSSYMDFLANSLRFLQSLFKYFTLSSKMLSSSITKHDSKILFFF